MTKDEAEAIHQLARQLLEEDVSCETRCRLARKIIEHAKAIKADPAVKFGGNGQTGSVSGSKPVAPPESPVIFEPTCYTYEFGTNIQTPWQKYMDEVNAKNGYCKHIEDRILRAIADYPGFMPVTMRHGEWLSQGPEHDGERILWSDGSVHGFPEYVSEYVTVLRRIEPPIPANYG